MADDLAFVDRLKVWRAAGCGVSLSHESIDQLICLMETHLRDNASAQKSAADAAAKLRVARLYLLLGVVAFTGAAVLALGGGG